MNITEVLLVSFSGIFAYSSDRYFAWPVFDLIYVGKIDKVENCEEVMRIFRSMSVKGIVQVEKMKN